MGVSAMFMFILSSICHERESASVPAPQPCHVYGAWCPKWRFGRFIPVSDPGSTIHSQRSSHKVVLAYAVTQMRAHHYWNMSTCQCQKLVLARTAVALSLTVHNLNLLCPSNTLTAHYPVAEVLRAHSKYHEHVRTTTDQASEMMRESLHTQARQAARGRRLEHRRG